MTYNAKDLCESLHCTYIYTSPIEKNSQDFILTKKVYQETFRKKELQGTSRLYRKLPVASYRGKHRPATVVLLAFALREGKCCS